MSVVRLRVLAGVVVLVLAGLSGCGQDDGYCEVAQDNQAIFVDDGTGVGLLDNIPKLQLMADAAPEDIQDEWQTFIAAVTGLRDAITAVGLQPADFRDGEPPASTPEGDKEKIAAAAGQLSQPDVLAAASGVEQHAKDVCKFQLGL